MLLYHILTQFFNLPATVSRIFSAREGQAHVSNVPHSDKEASPRKFRILLRRGEGGFRSEKQNVSQMLRYMPKGILGHMSPCAPRLYGHLSTNVTSQVPLIMPRGKNR